MLNRAGSEVWLPFLLPGMCLPGCNLTPGSPPASPLPAGLFIVDKPWHNGQHPGGLTRVWKPGQQRPPGPPHGAPTQVTVFTPNSRPRVTGQRGVSPSLHACVKDVTAMKKATPVPLPHTSVLPAPTQGPGPAGSPPEGGWIPQLASGVSSNSPLLLGSLEGLFLPGGLDSCVSLCPPLPTRDSKHFQARELHVEAERAQEESWGTKEPGDGGGAAGSLLPSSLGHGWG